jgi:hypothetical protein
MVTFEDFVVHVVQTLEQRGFVFLFKNRENSDFSHRIGSGLQNLDKRTGKLLGYVSKVTRSVSELPPGMGIFTDFMLNFENVRADDATHDAVFRLIGETFDLNAINFSISGVKYLACLDCDALNSGELEMKAQRFEEAALALRTVHGKTKPKILGLRFGRGIETDVFASLCFTFLHSDSYELLRSAVDRIELSSTSLGTRYLRGMRALVLNPMLFGNKGNTDLDKLVCRLYDRTIKSTSFGRRTVQRAMTLGMISYGFKPKELVP